MRKDTPDCYEVIVDTNIVFSAVLYSNGRQRELFDLCYYNKIKVLLLEIVHMEIVHVFDRNDISENILQDFFSIYPNIKFVDHDLPSDDEVLISNECLRDIDDRPIFIYAYRKRDAEVPCLLITGDKDLLTPEVRSILNDRVMTTSEFFERYWL